MDVATIPSTWRDAFEKHSIRDVRAFEKQLQAGASRDRERLRLLVGSNYRDLLDTAEEIVSLNGLTHAVEDGMSALGTLCQPPSLQGTSETRLSTASNAAQYDLLLKCVLASATSSGKGLFVQSAQLLTIARLLIGSLQESHLSGTFAEHITARISKARRSLLSRIDHSLTRAQVPNKLLTQLLSSYCLLSSASLTDAIEHFKRLRLERLKLLAGADPDKRQLHKVTRYVNASSHLLKALLGTSLRDGLQRLQQRPILDQISGHEYDVLGLDINRKLIPDDISNFVPFIQPTGISVGDAKAHLQQFNEESARYLKECADACLSKSSNISKILFRRTETIEILLSSSFQVHFPTASIELIDSSFVGRISTLIQKHGAVLNDLGSAIPQFADAEMPQNLWEDLSRRDAQEKSSPDHAKNVKNAHLGTTSHVHHFVQKLDLWSRRLRVLGDQIEQIKSIRWQDKISDYDDEDEPEVEAIVQRLSHEDASELTKSLQDITADSIRTLQTSIVQAAANIQANGSADATTNTASQAVTLLRLIRSVKLILNKADATTRLASQDDMIRSLHGVVVSHVVNDLEKKFEERDSSLSQASFAADDLPSPHAFSVLQYLCSQMSKVGGHDIWTRPVVDLLKGELTDKMLAQVPPSRYTCSDVDREYLRIALGPRRQEVGSGSDVSAEVRSAKVHWQKTRGLFGVLET